MPRSLFNRTKRVPPDFEHLGHDAAELVAAIRVLHSSSKQNEVEEPNQTVAVAIEGLHDDGQFSFLGVVARFLRVTEKESGTM